MAQLSPYRVNQWIELREMGLSFSHYTDFINVNCLGHIFASAPSLWKYPILIFRFEDNTTLRYVLHIIGIEKTTD